MNDKQGSGKLKVWLPLLFSIILIVGMVLGFNLRDTLRVKRNITTIVQRNDRLEEIIDLINERYVDSINSNLLYKDAVNGILSNLDPHTVYISADKLEKFNEDLEGSFMGIGVQFSIIRDTIQIISVIEGGPADGVGIQVGDKLVKVGDSLVAGVGITSDRIMKLLKGKRHTNVLVTIVEPSGDRARELAIKRDMIPIYSVEANIMLDTVTGYIKINRFSANTYEDFVKALQELEGQGMKSLIVDLRQNPGGYLEAATKIADEFLSGKKMIVYTKGVNSYKTEYLTEKNGLFESGALTILVDESSASASEILAGAVQDWDRGLIMGRRTYGKGLVQEQYSLEDGSALRLTIAKYYTPSGRSIQRSFDEGKDAYNADFMSRFESGELIGYDTLSLPDTTKYYTANRRVVYGGGGITPDIYVPYDTTKLSSGVLNLIYSNEVKNAIWDYYISNASSLKEYRSVKEFANNFDAEEVVLQYVKTLEPATQRVTEKVLKIPVNRAHFKLQVKAQIARILFNENGYYSIILTDDRMVQRAKDTMCSKNYIKTIGN